MLFCYMIALIPLIIGGILWIKNSEVVFWEWMASAAIGFVLSMCFHMAGFMGMTADTETWSGEVAGATFYPYWMEHYTTTETSTDSDGNTTTTTVHHWVPHYEYWEAETTIGDISISQAKYNELMGKFGGGYNTVWAYKSDFESGDHNIYQLVNAKSWIEPVNLPRSFTNRIKASPTTFSYPKVKDSRVYDYPANDDPFNSDRLLGLAVVIDKRAFELMNSRLGPNKKVNVIIVGFGADVGDDVAYAQEAKWIGGKKNDLVICYGGGTSTKPTWVKVFGWTESFEAKNNLETIVGTKGVSTSVLPFIEKEIVDNYTIKDWKKFDYISVEMPFWVYPWLIVAMTVTQVGMWIFFTKNEHGKESNYGYRRNVWNRSKW